jgi:hypothetical protein
MTARAVRVPVEVAVVVVLPVVVMVVVKVAIGAVAAAHFLVRSPDAISPMTRAA